MKLVPPALVLLLVGLTLAAERGKSISPQPNAPVPRAELLKLTGELTDAKLSRDIKILWLYGPEDHRGGEHDYIRIKELFVPMLQSIPRITVDEAYQFPTQAQFDQADLLIQYLHLPQLTAEQFQQYEHFVKRGGRVVSLHESCIMRPVEDAQKLAQCIGCAWGGNKASRWGKFDHAHSLHLKTDHPVFAGLPPTIRFNDESYWKLLTRDHVEVIGAIAPTSTDPTRQPTSFDQLLKKESTRSQAFWTYTNGKGKVFGTTTGHYTYTFYDPHYRLLLLRGIAWALDEDPAPFMPLVFQGITNKEGLVGTTDAMLDYTNRKR